MKKRRWLPILCVFVCLSAMLTMGCRTQKTLSCELTSGGEKLLDKEYALPFASAVRYGRTGSMEKAQKESGKTALEFLRGLDATLAEDIEECCERVTREKREPEIVYSGDGKFEFIAGKEGRAASPDEVAARLLAGDGRLSGEVPVRTVPPVLTEEDLRAHCRLMATFSTVYETSSAERKHNIALAVGKLDNATIESGESLSFNQTVGKRTEENGYREAGVIQYGAFTRGVGGGVCQVSTTLYNAWALAGLGSDSKNHSLSVSYVPLGLDAMVSENSDLVLKNDSPFPVFLDAACDGKKVTFSVYGTPTGEEIKLWSRAEAVFPCDDYDVTYGDEERVLSEPKPGSLYRSFRDRYKNGVLVRREPLRESRYLPVKGKKITRAVPPENPPQENE